MKSVTLIKQGGGQPYSKCCSWSLSHENKELHFQQPGFWLIFPIPSTTFVADSNDNSMTEWPSNSMLVDRIPSSWFQVGVSYHFHTVISLKPLIVKELMFPSHADVGVCSSSIKWLGRRQLSKIALVVWLVAYESIMVGNSSVHCTVIVQTHVLQCGHRPNL